MQMNICIFVRPVENTYLLVCVLIIVQVEEAENDQIVFLCTPLAFRIYSPVTVSAPHELLGDDAGEGVAHQGAVTRLFQQSTGVEVNVVGVTVEICKMASDLHVGHLRPVVERCHRWELAQHAVGVVVHQAVVPSSLDVQGAHVGEIEQAVGR